VLQVLPDWALVEVAGHAGVPRPRRPRFGDAVPLYMAGLWVPPLLAVLLLARGRRCAARWRPSSCSAWPSCSPRRSGLWEPLGARQVGSTAVYVLPAEAVLGAAVVVAARTRGRRASACSPRRAVALLYTGALFVSLLLIDRGALVVAT
jgi:hypothetical protein